MSTMNKNQHIRDAANAAYDAAMKTLPAYDPSRGLFDQDCWGDKAKEICKAADESLTREFARSYAE